MLNRFFRSICLPVIFTLVFLPTLGQTTFVHLCDTFWIVVTFHAIQTALCGATLLRSGKLDSSYKDGLIRITLLALVMAYLVLSGNTNVPSLLLPLFGSLGMMAVIDTNYLLFHMIDVYAQHKE